MCASNRRPHKQENDNANMENSTSQFLVKLGNLHLINIEI